MRVPSAELSTAYEAIRAQARGEIPTATPRGLALFLNAGMPGWMQAWVPLAPAPPAPPSAARSSDVGLGGEVVKILTAMALGCQGGLTT